MEEKEKLKGVTEGIRVEIQPPPHAQPLSGCPVTAVEVVCPESVCSAFAEYLDEDVGTWDPRFGVWADVAGWAVLEAGLGHVVDINDGLGMDSMHDVPVGSGTADPRVWLLPALGGGYVLVRVHHPIPGGG